jgi:FkbM family methyltransferase
MVDCSFPETLESVHCHKIEECSMSEIHRLPASVRVGFFWNKYGLKGRGYLTRLIGCKLVKEGDYVVQTKHGAKLAIDLRNLDIYATIFNSGGEWEPHIARTCQRLLRKSDIFFDIGANAGCISLDTRAFFGEDICMFLFEPQPSLSNSIKKSIAINRFNNINVLETLLGNHDGTAALYLTSHAIHASMIPREDTFNKLVLPICKIDTLIASGRCSPPDVIKMDTEGAELQILEGMRQTLTEYSPTILFEADVNMDRFGYNVSDLLKLIASTGEYDFYANLASGRLQRYQQQPTSDILAVARRHRDRIEQSWID